MRHRQRCWIPREPQESDRELAKDALHLGRYANPNNLAIYHQKLRILHSGAGGCRIFGH